MLENSRLWKTAKFFYDQNDLDYHNFEHVRRIYRWAEELEVPYSHELDEAILFHDAIWDGAGQHERRSHLLYDAVVLRHDDDGMVGQFIDATIDHCPSHPGSMMAMLDLADFLDDEQTVRNSADLACEARTIAHRQGKDFDAAEARAKNIAYLEGLAERILNDFDLNHPYAHVWAQIEHGVRSAAERLKAPSHLNAPI